MMTEGREFCELIGIPFGEMKWMVSERISGYLTVHIEEAFF
jgi:hypothetical protein